MSTAPTVTASAVGDLTLGDEYKIANCICVLAATPDDCTLLHPDSFKEKDIVELCIGLGQVHLEVVLPVSGTEMVLAFQSSSELIAMS